MNQDVSSPWPPENQNISSEEKYRELFVGNKYQGYYKKHFDLITPKKAMSGINIGALFLGPIWMIYRKMYAYAGIFIGAMLIFSIITEMLDVSEAADRGFSIGLAVALGMLGNTLYKNFVDKKIKSLSQKESPASMESSLRHEGGTNFALALIVFIILIAFVALGIYLELQGY